MPKCSTIESRPSFQLLRQASSVDQPPPQNETENICKLMHGKAPSLGISEGGITVLSLTKKIRLFFLGGN